MAGYKPTPSDVAIAKQNRPDGGASAFNDPMMKRSPDSASMLDYWNLTDTLVDGIDAVRKAGEDYLPKFVDEDDAAYRFRLKCTKLTNIYRDAVEGLAAKPFEQEVALVGEGVPTEIEAFTENVDGSGNNLTVFASSIFFNAINSALTWIFIDHPPPPKVAGRARTVQEVKASGVRPYWSMVLARNVLDVKSMVIEGNEVLTYIKIYEPGRPDKIREIERTETGVIVWRLFEKNDKNEFVKADDGTMTIDVIPLVPFVTARRDGRSWRFFPAMRDAADLQVDLFQQESALKFAKILAAYPMLSGDGVRPPMNADGVTVKKLAVGPGTVLYAPPDGQGNSGSWKYVEPSATSLRFLADDIKETQQQLRELARQPLTAQSGNVTVISSAVAAGKSKSAVKAWALMLKDALENAMVITCKWKNVVYDPSVNVFTEFDEFLEGKDLDALNSARDRGDISRETYWEEYQRRGVLSAEFDPDIEAQRLLDELPGDGIDTTDGEI